MKQEKRILTEQGEDGTFSVAHTASDLTHSFTMDVAISMPGKLGHKTHNHFQEPEGEPGTFVKNKY
jgi:hypothetical protein